MSKLDNSSANESFNTLNPESKSKMALLESKETNKSSRSAYITMSPSAKF